MRLDEPPPAIAPAHSEDDVVVASDSDDDEAISDEDEDDEDDDEDDDEEDGDDEDEDDDDDYDTHSPGLPLERELPAVVGDDAPLPVPGRSTPAMGPANPLLEMLHAPPDGGSRKRKRGMHPEADAQGPMVLRMPMVTPFRGAADAWSDLVLRPWSESAAKVLRPRKGYMQHQPNITHTLRVALIDWLIEIVEVSASNPPRRSAHTRC